MCIDSVISFRFVEEKRMHVNILFDCYILKLTKVIIILLLHIK